MTGGGISGFVRDSSGAVLPRATIRAVSTGQKLSKKTARRKLHANVIVLNHTR